MFTALKPHLIIYMAYKKKVFIIVNFVCNFKFWHAALTLCVHLPYSAEWCLRHPKLPTFFDFFKGTLLSLCPDKYYILLNQGNSLRLEGQFPLSNYVKGSTVIVYISSLVH